jgi:hypothetical protein
MSLIEILKEMGVAKKNQQLIEKLVAYHRDEFRNTFGTPLCERHRREYEYWSNQLGNINRHIEQQHRFLKQFYGVGSK